jgi:signal transduction histidine kinase
MPIEYALIAQFVGFNFLYFVDARATVRGWFPPWYSTYRFVLTFFVGASIVVSLVGRGQIVRHDHESLRSPVDSLKADRDAQWEALEREERERIARIAEEEEAESGDGEGKEEDEDDS